MSKAFNLWFLLLVTLSAAPQADEIKSRQVIGGDLIYSATSTGNTEEQAIFKAESQAVRMIAIECSVPHRETKIFKFSVNPVGAKYVAQVSAGLDIEACEQARNAPNSRKEEFTNPTLAASQRVYEQFLEGERTPAQNTQPAKPILPVTWSSPARFVWTPPGYDRYLSEQVDCRERMRNLIRRNETSKASAPATQCRN
jgi:hypothetical protein